MIRIETCESTRNRRPAARARLPHARRLRIDVVLETVNATRAFLTIDSGFPLAELEQALRTNRPFTLDYHPAARPGALRRRILAVRPKDKTPGRVHRLLPVRSFALPPVPGLSKLDPETAEELRKDDSRASA